MKINPGHTSIQMYYKGITYDTGTEYNPGQLTRGELLPEAVRSDMDAIKSRLHCNAVRIYGKLPERLLSTAELALQTGLHVWISPRLINGDFDSTLYYLHSIAVACEALRRKYPGPEMVFIIGSELTLEMNGFVRGTSIYQRIESLTHPFFFFKKALGIRPPYQRRFQEFLSASASLIKTAFSGKITYAAGMWEGVDWSDLDFVSVNLYKASFNRHFFQREIKKLKLKRMPLAITEFGCCCFKGADKKGPIGYRVLDQSKNPPVFREHCIRDEKVQADYITDLLQTFESEGIDGTFVFDFLSEKLPHSPDPEKDFDMASFSVTKSMDGRSWEPKESFYKIGECYA